MKNRHLDTMRNHMLSERPAGRGIKILGLIAVLALAFSANLSVAASATWMVTKTADTNDGVCDNDCSLREAIAAAASGDTIVFAAGLSGGTSTLGGTLILSKDVTIDGSALAVPITIDGVNAYRVFYVNAGVTATLGGLTIAHGRADFGGGIYNQGNLMVTNSLVSGNSAPGAAHWGGGILNARYSTLTVRNSTFSGNSADDRGGGIYNQGTLTVADSTFAGNNAGIGGGIYSHIATMTLNNSTFIGNSAFACGGVYNNYHIMTMSNCTFSENRATGSAIYGGNGGGLCSDGQGAVLLNSTFSGNSAAVTGGGIYYSKTYWFSTLTLVNTVIANSPAGGDCYTTDGVIDTNRNNLVEDGSCSANGVNFKTGDPLLGSLADNGGPTWTFALLSGSSAINAGDNATCAAPPVSGKDQRGNPRNDAQCDIGAFELEPNQPPVADAGGPYTAPEGGSVTLDGTGSYDPDPGDTLTYAWDLDNDGNFEISGATPSFTALDGPASQPVSLQVCDLQVACDTDTTIVEVTNVGPTANAGADVTVYRNETVALAGTWTDPAAALDEPYAWSWDLDGDGAADVSGADAYGTAASATASFATEGVYDLTFTVIDADGDSGQDTVRITVLNHAPDCAAAAPSSALLWPPNNKFVPVAIGGATDAEGDALTLAVTSIWQDEPVGKGNSAPDGKGIGAATAELRAEKLGSGNGRFYHVSFTASDGHGGACTGVVRVAVPHDQAKPASDGGPLYDSTVPTP